MGEAGEEARSLRRACCSRTTLPSRTKDPSEVTNHGGGSPQSSPTQPDQLPKSKKLRLSKYCVTRGELLLSLDPSGPS